MTTGANNSTIMVVGATGYLGMDICRKLKEQHKSVRALVRKTSDPAKLQALESMGVETVVGDMKDPASLDAAMEGINAVISTASSTLSRQPGDAIDSVDEGGQINVVNAAKKAGAQQMIYISFNKMAQEFPLQTAKRAVEDQLKSSGLNYTILQPTFFMEVWLSPALGFDYPNSSATIYGEGKNKLSWISLRDVASFAVASLDNPLAKNTVIELGGPEALSPLEVVEIFEKRSGNSYNKINVPVEALRAQKEQAPDPLSKSFASFMLAYEEGNHIDMKAAGKIYAGKLQSVSDYAGMVIPG